jgi:hypothetical protein
LILFDMDEIVLHQLLIVYLLIRILFYQIG